MLVSYKNMSLLKKLLLITFLPLLGLALMSALYLNFVWLERKHAIVGLEQVGVIKELSSFVHELQKEGGLSVGFVSSQSGGATPLS